MRKLTLFTARRHFSYTETGIFYRVDRFEIQGQSFQLVEETRVAHNPVSMQPTKWGVQEVYHNCQHVHNGTKSLLLVLRILHVKFHVPVCEISDSG